MVVVVCGVLRDDGHDGALVRGDGGEIRGTPAGAERWQENRQQQGDHAECHEQFDE